MNLRPVVKYRLWRDTTHCGNHAPPLHLNYLPLLMKMPHLPRAGFNNSSFNFCSRSTFDRLRA